MQAITFHSKHNEKTNIPVAFTLKSGAIKINMKKFRFPIDKTSEV